MKFQKLCNKIPSSLIEYQKSSTEIRNSESSVHYFLLVRKNAQFQVTNSEFNQKIQF